MFKGTVFYSNNYFCSVLAKKLMAARLQDKRQLRRQEMCKRPSLHHNYIFLALASLLPKQMFLTIQLTALDIWFGTMDDIATRKQILHALAASCMESRQFFSESTRHMSLIRAVHNAIQSHKTVPLNALCWKILHGVLQINHIETPPPYMYSIPYLGVWLEYGGHHGVSDVVQVVCGV